MGGLCFLKMAAKKKFNIPTVDELEEKKTPQIASKRVFKLFRRINDSNKPDGEEESSRKGDIHEKNSVNRDTSKQHETCRSSTNLKSSEHKLVKQASSSSNNAVTSCTTATTNFSTASWSKTGGDLTSRDAENNVGKSFKDTFAFLKNTRHYEEAEAKMKEIESSKAAASKVKPTVPSKPKPNAIQVNPRQKGNPVLKFIRCVPWEYSDVTPDYVMGATTCALFLSLRYHHFNPNYIHDRLRLLGKSYELRILLVLVDVKDPHQTLRELAKMAIMADLTLMLTWSSEEAGKYLETYKVYENKPVDALQGQNDGDHFSKLQDCLTTVKGINKTDVLTLNTTFGTLAEVTKAPKDDLIFLPGFGPLKAKRLHGIFHEPFLAKKKKSEDDVSAVNTG